MWDGAKLTPRLLQRYIKEGLLHEPIFESMVEVERSYRIEKGELIFSTFGLDPIALEENLRNS